MIDRRSLLRGALLGAGMSAFSGRVLASAGRALGLAKPRSDGHQILFVFQRGGNDGVNTLIPHLDATYAAARPTLQITNGIALPGMPYSRLNPNLQRLVGVDHLGNLAMIHQVGDSSASRSHFTAMDMFEKALAPSPPPTQTQIAQATGFVPKMLGAASVAPFGPNSLPAAVSFSGLMQTMFSAGNSTQVSSHVRSLAAIGAPQAMQDLKVDEVSLQHGVDHFNAPSSPVDQQLGYELAFGHGTNEALRLLGYSPAFASTGRFPLTAAELAQAASATGSSVVPTYAPGGAAFMQAAEQAVFTLINSPGTRVVGIETGGWDTHADQAADHPNLLRYLGWALRDMHDEILASDAGDRITIVVVTEFGRTARENGSNGPGTDHGVGGVALAIGGRVRGGSWNIRDAAHGSREFGLPWKPLTAPPTQTKYNDAVEVATEFRDVLAEVMVECIGVPVDSLPIVMPGYPTSTAGFIGFLQ